MSVEVALQAIKLHEEFTTSVELLEKVRSSVFTQGHRHWFNASDGKIMLITGDSENSKVGKYEGEFDVSLAEPVSDIIDGYLNSLDDVFAEEYVLGLYMHDPSRDKDTVTALGKFVTEGVNA